MDNHNLRETSARIDEVLDELGQSAPPAVMGRVEELLRCVMTLYAGLTMVTNVPFYSFKDLSIKRSVPFVVIVLIALGIAIINIHVPGALFGLFVAYGVSGYCVYVWKKLKGKPVSVIATSTDEPDEQGLHR